jgi:hypothetical protein
MVRVRLAEKMPQALGFHEKDGGHITRYSSLPRYAPKDCRGKNSRPQLVLIYSLHQPRTHHILLVRS